jgi:hypothetical protein
VHALLDDAERLRQQLFTPTRIHSFGGKGHTYASRDVPQPLFRDQRDIMLSVSTAITASPRIDDHDTGAEGARSMVGSLFDALRGAFDQMQDTNDDSGG